MATTTALPLQSLWGKVEKFFAKMQRQHSPRQLRLKETLALGDKRQLLIVECGRRRLLIGAAGNFMAALAELEQPDAVESGARE